MRRQAIVRPCLDSEPDALRSALLAVCNCLALHVTETVSQAAVKVKRERQPAFPVAMFASHVSQTEDVHCE